MTPDQRLGGEARARKVAPAASSAVGVGGRILEIGIPDGWILGVLRCGVLADVVIVVAVLEMEDDQSLALRAISHPALQLGIELPKLGVLGVAIGIQVARNREHVHGGEALACGTRQGYL
ncbi:MAG: hypothetical protein ACO3QV_07120, partial [Candidatus Nanopelagicaceae bacterium]